MEHMFVIDMFTRLPWAQILFVCACGLAFYGGIFFINFKKYKELIESRLLLKTILDSSDDFIWSVNPVSFNLLSFNKSLSSFCLTEKNMKLKSGMSLEEFHLTSDLVAWWRNLYEKTLRDGTSVVEYKAFSGDTIFLIKLNLIKNGEKVFSISGFAKNITDQKKTELLLKEDVLKRKEAEVALHNYINAVVDAQEVERRRIARELHEGVIQLLGVVLQHVRSPDVAKVSRYSVEDLLNKSITEIRRICYSLRPSTLDDLGLEAALSLLCTDYQARMGLEFEIHIEEMKHRFNSAIELAIFRITQEALTNIEKHAKASKVKVMLGLRPSRLFLNISDNGQGFVYDEQMKIGRGQGLRHIRERAQAVGGNAQIISKKEFGTSVEVSIPV